MSFLSVSGAVKSFGSNTVVKGFDLSVEKGEFVSFLGPSGCGKTTVLRMIAGFERPTAGRIMIDGRDVTDLAPNKRRIGMVFQAYALFPNMNVAGNVAFGLKIAGLGKDESEARVREMLGLVGLSHLADRYPYQLSGGQQQRVALARALAPQPRVLLLDEPLSALDAKIRVSLRTEMREIQQKLGITTIFVTHDQEEALSISDRVVVMNAGIADQIGTPFEVYTQPRTRFVANFVGTLNTLEGTVTDPSQGAVSILGVDTRLPAPVTASKGSSLALALRPEALHLGPGRTGDVVVPATITSVQFMGAVIRVKATAAGQPLSLDTFNRADAPPPAVGTTVPLSFATDDLIALQA